MKFLIPLQLLLLALSLTGCAGIGRAIPVTVHWKSANKSGSANKAEPATGESTPSSEVRDIPADLGIEIDDPRRKQELLDLLNATEKKQDAAAELASRRSAADASSKPRPEQTEQPTTTDLREVEAAAGKRTASAPLPGENSQQRTLTSHPAEPPKEETPEVPASKIETAPSAAVADSIDPQPLRQETAPPREQVRVKQTAATSPVVPASLDTEVEATAEPPAPGAWKQQLSSLIESLEDQLAKRRDSLNEAETEHLETVLAMLYLMANDREAALQSLDIVESDKETFWKELMFAISVVMERDELDVDAAFFTGNHRRAAIALEHLRKAQEALSPIASLQVNNITLCEEVNGFGNYQPFPSRSFDPGQQTIVYCEIENYSVEVVPGSRDGGNQFESEFRSNISIFDENRQIIKQIDYQPIVDRGRNRRRDFYIHYTMSIPENLPKGTYFLALQVEDVKAGKAANSPPLEFRVR